VFAPEYGGSATICITSPTDFHQDGTKFLSGRNFFSIREEKKFYQGENLRRSERKRETMKQKIIINRFKIAMI
jgi:hypothetical protein